MRRLQTDVLVIGGGATGTGILRDLSMRGFKCALVERRDLAYGTTGRYHGLLHSGGRYAVKDPVAAKECIEENLILRRIMPQCIEDTSGFFVLTPVDDAEYAPKFISGCHNAGIPIEEISIRQMLKEEPALDPKIMRCFRVPDGSADSFLAAELNIESARHYGSQIFLYHEVISLSTSQDTSTARKFVNGAICRDLVSDEEVVIDAAIVVNASGAWVGKIANMVGISLQMLPGKGTMVAINHRIVNTVINRCKLPSDGDILVPAHTVAVMGTTDIRVTDPDSYSIEPWEIRLMLDEGEKLIPSFKQFRILRAWAGVRPLLQDANSASDRDISRAFTLIDHSVRDGIEGLISITGGKWTTYRKMAEVTVDKVCEKLHTSRTCRTHLEELPSSNGNGKAKFYLGERLEKVDRKNNYGELVCECELVTIDEVEKAIIQKEAVTLDDIRRDVRLGMGPCQAAFCAIRAAGILHQIRRSPITEMNTALFNFLQERWKGNLPILWGQQLRQERFNELIYINNLNLNHLSGNLQSNLSPESYAKPAEDLVAKNADSSVNNTENKITTFVDQADVIVIGSGLSGLMAGWRTSAGGKKTHIITKGWGSTYWTSGCIDIFGYKPPEFSEMIDSPISYLEEYIQSNEKHPYALVGIEQLESAVDSFIHLMREAGYPYQGSLNKNLILPTALGSLRPTCLAPVTMAAGDMNDHSPMLIVGFNKYFDFYPGFIADNLNAQGMLARDVMLELKTLRQQKFISAVVLARLFDKPEFRQEVIDTLKPMLRNVERVGFPAVLGFNKPMDVIQHLESSLGVRVFEITGLPPSIPGIRLHNAFIAAIEKQQGLVNNGMLVSSASFEDRNITAVYSEASARQFPHSANNYILATGGILGGGIIVNSNGYAKDTVFQLPITIPRSRINQFQGQFFTHQGHSIFSCGLQVDPQFRPIGEDEQITYNNLFTIGSSVGNCDPLRELSMEGIALATGFKVGDGLV